jgi:hypothetical protein
MSDGSNSGTLYHYADNAGLLGIFTSGELWFSDVRFLNDTQEIHCSLKIGDHTIKETAKMHRDTWVRAGCLEARFDIMVSNIRDTMRRNTHH